MKINPIYIIYLILCILQMTITISPKYTFYHALKYTMVIIVRSCLIEFFKNKSIYLTHFLKLHMVIYTYMMIFAVHIELIPEIANAYNYFPLYLNLFLYAFCGLLEQIPLFILLIKYYFHNKFLFSIKNTYILILILSFISYRNSLIDDFNNTYTQDLIHIIISVVTLLVLIVLYIEIVNKRRSYIQLKTLLSINLYTVGSVLFFIEVSHVSFGKISFSDAGIYFGYIIISTIYIVINKLEHRRIVTFFLRKKGLFIQHLVIISILLYEIEVVKILPLHTIMLFYLIYSSYFITKFHKVKLT